MIKILENNVYDESVKRITYILEKFERVYVSFSGGKDSTLVAQAVLEAILAVRPSARTREVHMVSNDTLVESPLVIAHMSMVQKQIED